MVNSNSCWIGSLGIFIGYIVDRFASCPRNTMPSKVWISYPPLSCEQFPKDNDVIPGETVHRSRAAQHQLPPLFLSEVNKSIVVD